MREIKFRAWDKVEKRFDTEYRYLSMDFYGNPINLRTGGGGPEYILEQYTELDDKNGKEIYEGDIVKYSSVELKSDTGIVEYEKKRYAGFSLKSTQTGSFSFLSNGSHKIIGNIHENPELLEKL